MTWITYAILIWNAPPIHTFLRLITKLLTVPFHTFSQKGGSSPVTINTTSTLPLIYNFFLIFQNKQK